MHWRNSPQGYGAAARLAHWLSALFVGLAWALGTVGDDLPKGSVREFGEFVHISAGELIALLLIFRLAWRLFDPPPHSDPTPLGRAGDLAAKAVHLSLYALLGAVVAFGVATQFADGDALPLFGLFDIASPWPKDKNFSHDMEEIHETLANLLVVIATIHAASALIHHFIFHDGTLSRMMSGPSRSN